MKSYIIIIYLKHIYFCVNDDSDTDMSKRLFKARDS